MLGQDPNIHKLTLYKKTTSLKVSDDDSNNNSNSINDVKNVIFIESKVRVADQPHTYPCLNICFAAVC